MFKGTKADQEYERRIKESLADEYIIDPETGARLTLEEAESGHWIQHDNEYNTVSEQEIDKLHTEEQKDAERAINYLRKSKEYRKYRFTESELKILENTKILSKYDDWGYSDSYKIEFCNGYFLMPAVVLIDKVPGYFDTTYNESHIMAWIKLKVNLGHYYLREKTATEKFFDIFKNDDDDIKIKGFESFTFKRSENILKLNDILNKLREAKGVEIEFFDNNIFLKTQKFINVDELLLIEKLVKNVC
jgi:hypothetical protein